MTYLQKRQMYKLRSEGLGYRKIAAALGIPVSTVRQNIIRLEQKKPIPKCMTCGKVLVQKEHRKAKKFCSDKCRMMWWNSHPELVIRKAYYTLTCQNCGKEFESYGNKNRKFCSRECYYEDRRKKNAAAE